MPDTAAAEVAIPMLATNIKALRNQRYSIATKVEELLDDFRYAAHLAAHAGIAPVTRRSGTSISGEFPVRSGNNRLKNVLFRSAWVASNCHESSRSY